MCLAIPARITEIDDDRIANVDILGAQRSASLDLVPQAAVGDYVLVHAGFAIEVVDPQFAQETLDLVAQFPELIDLDNPAGARAPGGSNVEASASIGTHGMFAALSADLADADSAKAADDALPAEEACVDAQSAN